MKAVLSKNILALIAYSSLLISCAGNTNHSYSIYSTTNSTDLKTSYIIAGEDLSFNDPLSKHVVLILKEVTYKNEKGQTAIRRGTCTGSFISSKIVLSAAHCFRRGLGLDNYIKEDVRISTDGKLYRKIKEMPTSTSYEPKIIHIPDRYKTKGANQFDVALIELKTSKSFSNRALEILEPSSYEVLGKGTELLIIGYGVTSDGNTDYGLRIGAVSIEKKDATNHEFTINTSQSDFCGGDSGGPGLFFNGENYMIAGILKASNCVLGESAYLTKTFAPEIYSWIAERVNGLVASN